MAQVTQVTYAAVWLHAPAQLVRLRWRGSQHLVQRHPNLAGHGGIAVAVASNNEL